VTILAKGNNSAMRRRAKLPLAFKVLTLGAAVLFSAQSFAGVTLMNVDRKEHAVSIKCKADIEAIDDIIEINGLLDLESGPCTVKLKANNQVVTANDGDVVEIRGGKIALQ
jgi:hypothetical protein